MGGATWKIIEMEKNVFFPTGNDISQLFKVSAKKFKRKGLKVHTLLISVKIIHMPEVDKYLCLILQQETICDEFSRDLFYNFEINKIFLH